MPRPQATKSITESRITPYSAIAAKVAVKHGVLITQEKDYLTDHKAPIKIICAEGHPFSTSKKGILVKGTWCPLCGRKRSADAKRGSIDEYEEIIRRRGGTLLPSEYKNNTSKLHIDCGNGHDWWVSAHTLKSKPSAPGTWCPQCNHTSRGEKLCRAVFEYCFGAPFERQRPDWLQMNRYPLELDGFNEALKIAFEYQGPHHYVGSRQVFSEYSKVKVEDVKKRDRFKKTKCKEHGVRLIVIPTFGEKLDQNELDSFLETEFGKLRLRPKNKPSLRSINLEKLYLGDGEEYLKRAQKIATKYGGLLLSKTWEGATVALQWQCKNNHTWSALYQSVVNKNVWCEQCIRLTFRGKTQKEIQTVCLGWGLKLISKYTNARDKASFQCTSNIKHKFTRVFFDVSKIKGCPLCKVEKLHSSLKEPLVNIEKIIRGKGGKVLSGKDEYKNQRSYLTIRCKKTHAPFPIRIHNIKNGHWCPICGGRKKSRAKL